MKNILKKKLKNIATIHTGFFQKPQNEGKILYLQVKHFDSNANLKANAFPDLMKDEVNPRHLLKAGDILFAAKGTNNFAAEYQENFPKAVASTSFLVVRLTDNNVIPEFLAWFINHPSSIGKLKTGAKGTSISSISKTTLSELEILIPSIKNQLAIIEIDKLRKKEKQLLNQIDKLREQFIQQQIFDTLKKSDD